MVTRGLLVTCLLNSLGLYCISLHCVILESQKVSLPQVFNPRMEIVAEQLSWTEMWKSKISSAGTDLRLDPQQWW